MSNITLLNVDCMTYMKDQPDNSFDLIIVDPPYFEVKGKFDFIFKSFDEYLLYVDKWAKELSRMLKKNGTLFWYGHAKKIAYTQIILDKYLNLENSLVWWKFDAQTNKGVDGYRCFPPVTERILMYSKEIERTGLDEIKLDVSNFQSLRGYFERMQNNLLISKKELLKTVGTVADHCFRWNSTQWDMPTKDTYLKILPYVNSDTFIVREYEELRIEYEELRIEYEELRRPFNNFLKLVDVMRFSQQAEITGQHNHPTQKPKNLTEAIIHTVIKKDSRAFIPFSGSGTELIACHNAKIQAVGCEIDEDYYKAACERFDRETRQLTMF